MNLLHIAEAASAFAAVALAADVTLRKAVPAAWRWATAKKPKLLDEARTILTAVEGEAATLVHGVEAFAPRNAEAAPVIQAVEAASAPVAAAVEAVAQPVIAELEADGQALVTQVQTYLATKDAAIANKVTQLQSLQGQRDSATALLKGMLA